MYSNSAALASRRVENKVRCTSSILRARGANSGVKRRASRSDGRFGETSAMVGLFAGLLLGRKCLYPEKFPPAPVIASHPRDFNIPDLGGRVCPGSIRTASTTFLPLMQSRIQAASRQARNPAATLGFLRSRPARHRASVIA